MYVVRATYAMNIPYGELHSLGDKLFVACQGWRVGKIHSDKDHLA